MTRKDKMMKNKIIKSAIAIAAVLTLSVGVSAAQIAFDNKALKTKSVGTATIRGGLYTTSSDPGYSYRADTRTSIAIGENGVGVTGIKVKFPSNFDGGITETRKGYIEVDDLGNSGVSSHFAYSDATNVYISLPKDQ